MPTSEMHGASPLVKTRRIGLEASRSIALKIESGFVAKYLSGGAILDIGYRGYSEDVEPVVPQATGVELDYPGYDGRTLPFGDHTQDAVFASHCLEHIDDYQNAFREWHRVLKIGGFMVIAVPHQFLYERRTEMPSKWNADHKRFYTPASLMAEVERSLVPNTYRLRHLIDNDQWFDYSVSPDFHAGGCYEVELVLERIQPPGWRFEGPDTQDHQILDPTPEPDRPLLTLGESNEAGLADSSDPRAAATNAEPDEVKASGLLRAYRGVRTAPARIFKALEEIASAVTRQDEKRAVEAQMHRSKLQNVTVGIKALRDDVLASQREVSTTLRGLQAMMSSHDIKMKIALQLLGDDLSAASGQSATRDAAAAESSANLVSPIVGDMRLLIDLFPKQSIRLDQQSAKIDHNSGRIDNLSMLIAEQARMYPSWEWTPDQASALRDLLRLIVPAAVSGVHKTRMGSDRDGGYVMLDSFDGIQAALSLGVADDVSWDKAIADCGIDVLQFDPTVAASPVQHARFQFEPLRVAAQDGEGTIRLNTIVFTRVHQAEAPLLLKMDIEGAEWEVLLDTDDEVLKRFDQIVCEFHELNRLRDDVFRARAAKVFGKLNHNHFVYHVHGNNCGSFVNLGNVVIPDTLELSFAHRRRYKSEGDAGLFPTKLDRPNEPGRADLYLGSFRF